MTPEDSYLLAACGYELYRNAVLTGGRPPMTEQLGQRMRSPQAGDLVLETSTLAGLRPDRWDPDRIGRLIRVESVPVVEGDEDGPRQDRHVVAPLHDPEREQGWLNATFVALPDRWKWTS